MILFVHPGYLRRNDSSKVNPRFIEEVRTDARYGSYLEYLSNLRRVYQKESKGIFLIELNEGRLHPYCEEFQPADGSIVIDWYQRSSTRSILEQRAGVWIQSERFMPEELGGILRAQGVKEVLLCGELGPWSQNASGCVGHICQLLEGTIDCKGIKDGIFPLVPFNANDKLKKLLYDEAVSIT